MNPYIKNVKTPKANLNRDTKQNHQNLPETESSILGPACPENLTPHYVYRHMLVSVTLRPQIRARFFHERDTFLPTESWSIELEVLDVLIKCYKSQVNIVITYKCEVLKYMPFIITNNIEAVHKQH